ncbi:[acyl-carrier-protein] S-malonyltransferase [bacterium (candidate division B38) B3_B38]|nr:MAG: [acyl-carrier-protein] S-malonyltransferase [bacterium (candidate division B38) B3_B38]
MEKIAFIFPGQASQYVGMGKELFNSYEESRTVFEKADQTLGFSISRLCFEGPAEEVQLTPNTQPAILTTSIAIWVLLRASGVKPDYVAGHSLGEYSALVAVESLSFEHAVSLVRKRGQYMQEAVPVGEGSMAAIIALERPKVEKICQQVGEGVQLANYNSPVQIVISGTREGVDKAVELSLQAGAKRATLLPVSAPFHSKLMLPAQEKLKVHIERTMFHPLLIPLVTNVDARVIHTPQEAKDSLIRQVTSPVRWEDSMRHLIAQGVSTFVEVGPGKVLTNLIKRINKELKTFNIEDKETLNKFLNYYESLK